MPLLPLTAQTLIYGSQDAGRTVVSTDSKFAAMMQQTAQELHVAPHIMKPKCQQEVVQLFSAGDVEGHHADGRYYVLDLARTLPPEHICAHLPRLPQAIFFRLFRAEFLQYLKSQGKPPLNPDALSGWGDTDPEKTTHTTNIKKATDILVNELIPSYVSQLLSLSWIEYKHKALLASIIHLSQR